MMNFVMLIGNLAANPEIRKLQSGAAVAKMRLAVNDRWTDRQTGQKREKTHWFNVTAWGRQAEIAEQYLHKGSKIAVQGSLEYREWQGQDGGKRSAVEVKVQSFEMLSPRQQRDGGSPQYGGPAGGSDTGGYEQSPGDQGDSNENSMDDDLPF